MLDWHVFGWHISVALILKRQNIVTKWVKCNFVVCHELWTARNTSAVDFFPFLFSTSDLRKIYAQFIALNGYEAVSASVVAATAV